MKKIRIRLLIIMLILISNIIYGIEKKEYNFFSKCMYLGENKKIDSYKIIKVDEIDYIEIEDLIKLLQELYVKTTLTRSKDLIELNKNDFKIAINLKNQTVFKYDKKLLMLSNIYHIFEDSKFSVVFPKNLNYILKDLTNDFHFLFPEEVTYKLSDFNSGIYQKKYFPLHLIGELFFHNKIQIYKNPKNDYYIFEDYYLYEEELTYFNNKENIITNFKVDGEKNKILSELTLKYLFRQIKLVYPGFKTKNIDIKKVELKYLEKVKKIETKQEFNYLINDLLLEFNDRHSGSLTIDINFEYEPNSSNRRREGKFSIKELGKNTIYINIPTFLEKFNFSGKSFNDYERIINQSENVILDLRDNFGGYPYDYISPLIKNKMICYYKKNNKVFKEEIQGKSLNEKNIILLINKNSYSQSTNYAANIKLNKIGVLIGETTGGGGYELGKPFILPDNNVVNIPTYAHVTDRKGNDFENGVEPDIFIEDKMIYGKDLIYEAALKYLEKIRK